MFELTYLIFVFGVAASDPRIWNREDVISFLRWCESEFDLPNFDMELFQMNGKLKLVAVTMTVDYKVLSQLSHGLKNSSLEVS